MIDGCFVSEMSATLSWTRRRIPREASGFAIDVTLSLRQTVGRWSFPLDQWATYLSEGYCILSTMFIS